jgi:hypothetical protein
VSHVTFADDSIRIRLFQAAVRLAAHFFEARDARHSDGSANAEQLDKRWLLLEGDHTVSEYVKKLRQELEPLKGQSLFDHIRSQLAKPFSFDQSLLKVNQTALDDVKECISNWGGVKAQARVKHLALFPIYLETTDHDHTQVFLEHHPRRIRLRPGPQQTLLSECLILEFSFFHEYLSHAFPAWSKDVEEVSEGLLLALEFEWFESQYTVSDNDFVLRLWNRRLEKQGPAFWVGRWLLKRCESHNCMKKFLLEWIASWDGVDSDANLDLLSQLKGMSQKAGRNLGSNMTDKYKKTQEIVDSVLCGPCAAGVWDIRKMRDELAKALEPYGPKK